MKPEIEHKTSKSQENRNKVVLFIPAKLRMGDKKETPRKHNRTFSFFSFSLSFSLFFFFFFFGEFRSLHRLTFLLQKLEKNKKNSPPPSPTKFMF